MNLSFLNRTAKGSLSTGLYLAFIILVSGLFVFSLPAKASLEGLQVGMKGPEFKLQGLDGKVHGHEEFFGEGMTVIIFWSTWSLKSSKALEEFEELYKEYHDKGLRVVAVSVEKQEITDTDLEVIKGRMSELGLTLTVMLDMNLQMFDDYGVIAIPSTVVMDSSRVILYELSGFPLVGSELMIDYVRGLLEGKEPSEEHVAAVGHKPTKAAIRYLNLGRKTMQKRTMVTMAEPWFRKAIEADPQFVAPYVELSRYYSLQGNAEEAQKLLTEGITLEPTNPMALCELALLKLDGGLVEESVPLSTQAVESDFYFTPAHYILGAAHARAGRKDEAMKHFEEALATNPFHPGIYVRRAEAHLASGDSESAAADLEKALNLLLFK